MNIRDCTVLTVLPYCGHCNICAAILWALYYQYCQYCGHCTISTAILWAMYYQYCRITGSVLSELPCCMRCTIHTAILRMLSVSGLLCITFPISGSAPLCRRAAGARGERGGAHARLPAHERARGQRQRRAPALPQVVRTRRGDGAELARGWRGDGAEMVRRWRGDGAEMVVSILTARRWCV